MYPSSPICPAGVRVRDVKDLGCAAQLLTMENGEKLLLLDLALDHDDRMHYLNQVMDEVFA